MLGLFPIASAPLGAVGDGFTPVTGTAAGVGSATAVGRSTAVSFGTAAGVGTATGVGSYLVIAEAVGVGTARGVAPLISSGIGRAEGVGRAEMRFYGQFENRSRVFSIPSTSLSRLKRRARWVVGGVETDVPVYSFGSYWQLHNYGTAGYRVFSGIPCRPDRFFLPSDAWSRIVTITPTSRLPWRSVIGPTLEPVNSLPDRVVIDGLRAYSVFCDVPFTFDRAFFVPTTAPLRIYERYAVNDGSPMARTKRPAVQFMGVGRYGFPKYTAWLKTSVAGKRNQWAAGDRFFIPKRYWIPHNPKSVQDVRNAVMAATRMADKVLLELGPHNRFIAGKSVLLADIDELVVGQP